MDDVRGVCLLNDSFHPQIDGVVTTVTNYAARLLERGYDTAVITPDYPGADDSAFPYPVLRYPSLDWRKTVGYTAGIPVTYKLMEQLREREISVLHSHCPVASNLVARSLRNSLDLPLILTYHTKFDVDIANVVRAKPLQQGLIAALIDSVGAADEVWTVSRGAGENLRKLGYKGDYTVVKNGVDIPRARLSDEKVRQFTAGYDLPDGVPVFLFVGRLMWYKGIGIILDALAALSSYGLDYRTVFVGGGGDEREIREKIDALGIGDKVIMTGPVHDRTVLTAWYCRADLFLFPSTFDTNGLVVREAAACSLACVLIRGSCAAEDITHLQNGLLIDENPASLAVCLCSVMKDIPLLRRLGAAAADQLYIPWSDAVDRAIELYGVVSDNYRAGRYPQRHRLTDEIFKMEADLDEATSGLHSHIGFSDF